MFIAKKPCSFEGRKFYIGDEIPDNYIQNPEAMEKMGVISVIGMGLPVESAEIVSQVAEVLFSIPIVKDGKTMEIDVSEPQIVDAVKILQMPLKDATAHIKGHVEDNTVLILLNALDSRASVKKETETKAAVLAEMEKSAGDS